MGVFNPSVLTKKGASLSAKVVAGITDLQFTKMQIGDSRLTGDISNLTDIGTVRQTENVSSVEREDNYNVSAYASISNKDLQQGYYIRAIGLYANDPDEGEILYCISTADENNVSADWMPPFTGVGLTSLSVGMTVAVSSTAEVSVTVGDTATVTVAQFNNHTEDKENPHGVTVEQIGAVQKAVFWYKDTDGDNLLNYVADLIRRGYTSGNVQISFNTGVPTDVPKRFLSRTSLFAQVSFTKYGFEYAEVTLSADAERSKFFRKLKVTADSSNWLFDWQEIISTSGYLPLDGSVAMSSTLAIGNGQAKFASNEYIATINAYKDVNNPQDAYGSVWVHNGGEKEKLVEAVLKESGKDAVTYQLFGTHNKPSGSYVGNSAYSRTITIGGTGNCLLIFGKNTVGNFNMIFIICGNISVGFTDGGANTVDYGVGSFVDGVFTTVRNMTNIDGVTYYYQVL